VFLQNLKRFLERVGVEWNHALRNRLCFIWALLLHRVRLHDRRAVLPDGIRSKVYPSRVILFAFLGAGVRLEAHCSPIAPCCCASVEHVNMPACPAIFAVAAFDDYRFNPVRSTVGTQIMRFRFASRVFHLRFSLSFISLPEAAHDAPTCHEAGCGCTHRIWQ
jgi:hypothetical protein